MKKVTLFCESANGKSGICRYVRELAKGLSEFKNNEFETRLSVRRLKEIKNLDKINVKYSCNALPGKIQDYIRKKIKYSDEILYGATDIVHEPNYNIPKVRKGTKKILTVYDVGWRLSDVSYGLSNSVIYEAERAIQTADKIITPTQSVKNDLVKFFNINPINIIVIPLGVDSLFLDDKYMPCGHQLPEEYWVFVGALTARKNLERAVEALSSMIRKLPLVIIGDNTEHVKKLTKLGEEKGVEIINITGIDDMQLKTIYSKSVGLVYPSLWEGFGLPIIEAAAVGTPIITSNNTSMQEIGKEFAFLVDPLSTQDICRAMERIISLDSAEKLLLKNKSKIISKKYTWKSCVDLHRNLYLTLI